MIDSRSSDLVESREEKKKKKSSLPSALHWIRHSSAPLVPAHLPRMHQARRRGCPAQEKARILALARPPRRLKSYDE